MQATEEHDFQLMERTDVIVYVEQPACQESRNQLDRNYTFTVCADYKIAELRDECQSPALKAECPVTCDACSEEESVGKFMWKKRLFSCSRIASKPQKKRDIMVQVKGNWQRFQKNFC